MIEKRYSWSEGKDAIVKCPKDYEKTPNLEYCYYNVQYFEGDVHVGGCFLWEFPMCCGVCISTNLRVDKALHGTQYPDKFRELTFQIAKELGFSLIVATFESNNIPQKKSSKNLGWKHIYEFVNKRTKHPLTLMVKDL